jgi:hypothetical protein
MSAAEFLSRTDPRGSALPQRAGRNAQDLDQCCWRTAACSHVTSTLGPHAMVACTIRRIGPRSQSHCVGKPRYSVRGEPAPNSWDVSHASVGHHSHSMFASLSGSPMAVGRVQTAHASGWGGGWATWRLPRDAAGGFVKHPDRGCEEGALLTKRQPSARSGSSFLRCFGSVDSDQGWARDVVLGTPRDERRDVTRLDLPSWERQGPDCTCSTVRAGLTDRTR